MKVLHIQKAAGIAGSERHLLSLLPRLRDHGIEVTMAVIEAPGGERFVSALRELDVPTVPLRAGRDLDPTLVPRLVRLVRRQHPDLVHTHLIHADVYGQPAAMLWRVPGVRTIHSTMPSFGRQPYRGAATLAGRLARRTIAISEYAGRFAIDTGLAPAARVRVVRYGVDADHWVLADEHRSSARASFGVAPDEIMVGVASRLFPNKGHDFLVAGVAAARRGLPSLRLSVAGDGPLRAALEVQAAPQGDAVRFLGYLGPDRLTEFMGACDLVAFPTLPGFGEGFGLAALEASAAGRPVLATNVASLPEIVEDGTTGLLVEPGDVDQLSSSLVRLARDPELRARMGAAGHERARSRFALTRMVDETAAVYKEALRGP